MAAVKKTICVFSGLILFLFLSPLHFAHNLWCRLVLRQPVPISGSLMYQVYAETLATIEEALSTFMPEADRFKEEIHQLTDEQMAEVEEEADVSLDPVYGRKYYFYAGIKDGKVIGYAGADSVQGKWGPIDYMISISPDGVIRDLMVIQYYEKRGRPVAKSRFLKQFFGKTMGDDIRLMKDIRGVTGASISSRGMTDGIRKMIHVFEVFYGKR